MGRGLLPVLLCALLWHAGVGSREQVQPPLLLSRRRSSWGGGASPALGGRRAAPVAPQLRWVRGGGGGGAAPPPALGPVWEGGAGSGGGPLVPWRCLLSAGGGGGRHGSPGPGGQPSARGSRPSPAPLYREPDPRAGPRWGPSSPGCCRAALAGRGVAVRVSGQWLAGCGAACSPPRSLSPHSLPWEVARHLASCRTVGGAWVGGPSPPPQLSRARRLGLHLRRRLCGGWGCGGGGLCRP